MSRPIFGKTIAVLLLLTAAAAVEGAAISSAPFSIGLGYTANTNVFDNTETASANTLTTIGDFSFNVSATTDRWSSSGVTFVNRTLANGPADNDYSANIDTALFSLPITASYNGPAPGNAAAIPNYRIRLELSNVSIWAGAHGSSSLKTLSWDEVTPGHASTSPAVAVSDNGWDVIIGYTQVSHDPADFDEPLATLNSAYTRTFDIFGGNGLRYGDGIEVEGVVHLIYDAVPEPATCWFAGIAGLALYASRQRGRLTF